MPNLSVFTFEHQEVRFVGTADEPEWVAADIVAILYPSASRSSYSKYLGKVPPEWKGKKQILTPGGKQKLTTLFEPGLYCLIGRSDSSLVVPFQRWLYEEVIPSIRKTGSYSLKQEIPPSTPFLPSAKERLETIKLGMNLLSELGGSDERTKVLLKDQVRNILLENKLQPSPTEISTTQVRLEYPVSDRAVFLGYRPDSRQLQQIGKQASRLYQDLHGTKPIQREQFVGGTTRMVNVYGFQDLYLLDQAILSVMDK
ncbi:MAG: BRO family protein [Xenococcaceae cyanobacterium MO_167.B27]|nr:BRO family protein [Xenococcaceae cyanobacterium MO_167.B27]